MSKNFRAVMIAGILGTQCAFSGAFAQEKIRLNPDYKAPTEQETLEFNGDLTQFLNLPTESDQYIQLTEPEGQEKSTTLFNQEDDNNAPLFQLSQQYRSDPSLSFGLTPGLIGGGINQGFLSSGVTGSQIVLSLNPSRQQSSPFGSHKTVEISLGSSFIKTPVSNYNSVLYNSFTSQRAYNLSLGLNYSGFNIGASFSRNHTQLMPDFSGYDLGFGYNGKSWSANVRIGEYNLDKKFLIGAQHLGLYENVSAYELGAAYQLFSNLSLTGRFTYYSYGLAQDIAPLDDVKSLVLGTNLSF